MVLRKERPPSPITARALYRTKAATAASPTPTLPIDRLSSASRGILERGN